MLNYAENRNGDIRLVMPSGKVINFYEIIPMYPEELQFKMENGADALFEKFEEKGIQYRVFSRKLNYKSLPNIRDLGGMRTDDGRQIKSGKLIRSGHLSRMPEDEVSALAGLVGAVIDFRSDGERIENPDALLADAEYYHFPVVQSLTPGVSREEESDRRAISQLLFTPEEAKNYMVEMYRSLASDYAVAQYAEFVRLLLQGNKKAVLWHCTAGKDRAGTAAVIIEEILGIPREVIIADLRSCCR